MSETPTERVRKNSTEITSILVTGLWLGALFTGQGWWLPALLVGYVVVVPIVELLFGEEDEDDVKFWTERWGENWWGEFDAESTSSAPEKENRRDALETLKDRYARGELTDEQFERKLENLMENDTVEDVEDRLRNENQERNLERE